VRECVRVSVCESVCVNVCVCVCVDIVRVTVHSQIASLAPCCIKHGTCFGIAVSSSSIQLQKTGTNVHICATAVV